MTSQTSTILSDTANNRQPRPDLSSLFQKGGAVPLTKACSIHEFLASLPGFTESYIAQRIQTIFHNGKAVDDIDSTILHDGDVLALSAAMPGLAGAIFRKGGRHAALRGRSDEVQEKIEMDSGSVTLKLFNMIATERGPELLSAGKIETLKP